MPQYLYRFRPTVLGKWQELENQEIFLCSLDKLNDPMEGFIDLFWLGDRVVWRNLLKHYILCLDRVCTQLVSHGSHVEIGPDSLPVFETERDIATQEHKDVLAHACTAFLGVETLLKWVDDLAASNRHVYRDQLSLILRSVHPAALNAILSAYRRFGRIMGAPGGALFQDWCENFPVHPGIAQVLNDAKEQCSNGTDGSDRLFAAARSIEEQKTLIAGYIDPAKANDSRRFVLFEFSDEYVRRLEQLVYGRWYTACFSASFDNSSMWGNYADAHRGVCLQFKTGSDPTRHSLSLHGCTGSVCRGIGQLEQVYGQADYTLHKVTYQSTHPPIDFFRSLGRPQGQAVSWWYSDGAGARSSCAADIGTDDWRARYWSRFQQLQATKLIDWEYEQEYRLVLSELVSDRSADSLRKYRYDFSDLEGIVFGIATPEADKLDIIRVIQRKCAKENRRQFQFYQAYYARDTGRIDVLPLRILKF